MLNRLSLRLRVFLLFAALGLGGALVTVGALAWAYGRTGVSEALPGFVMAGVISVFGIVALTALIWLLFDDNVAKPIQRLAADLRARAHSGVAGRIDADMARHLGDLAPAASAVTAELERATIDTAQIVAEETARLESERERLTAILSQVPVAVLLFSPDDRVILYDGQAAFLLGRDHPLGLNRPVTDYLDAGQLSQARAALDHGQADGHVFTLANVEGTRLFQATLRRLGSEAGFMLSLETEGAEALDRPLVFDFALIDRQARGDIRDTPLSDLTYVVFDTETTGLDPRRDAVVQLGAVRVVNERLIESETFDTLVDPGYPIPPSSTRIHGIDDSMVKDAPNMQSVCRRFERFCRDAVLVAHNAVFDLTLLQRCGVGRFDHPVLDTVLLSAELFGTEADHTLDAIAERLGVPLDETVRHTAMGDAMATALALRRMLPMLRARGIVTFGDVAMAMRRHSSLCPDPNGLRPERA